MTKIEKLSRRELEFHPSVGALLMVWFLLLLPAAAAETVPYEDKLDRFLTRAITDGAIPGMALAIVKDGKIVLAKGYGLTGAGEAFAADTPILIASLSKAMTAAVVLMLVAEERIDLDAPVQRYLPEFRVQALDTGAAITVRHLLNQTSGLSDPGFPDMRMNQPKTLAERVASLQAAVPEDTPGTTFRYFNANYSIAARIVEVVAGNPFEFVLKQKLFKPLHMTGTSAVETFAEAQARTPAPATGHVSAYGRAWRWHEPGGFIGGHGGVVSTASDMGRWVQWQMTGQPDILRPDLLALMQTPPAAGSYAMGWFRQAADGETTLWHDGVFSTVLSDVVIKRERKLGIVLLYGVGGALPAVAALPRMRAAVLAVANGDAPEVSGTSLVTIGRWAGVVTSILMVAALIDVAVLLRCRRWAGPTSAWRIALGLVTRLLPIALLLSLPWVLQHNVGRAFSFEAVFFAMLDVTAGLAIVGSILATSAFLRLVLLVWTALSPTPADPATPP